MQGGQHNLWYPETSLMAHGKTLSPTSSPSKVWSISSYIAPSVNVPLCPDPLPRPQKHYKSNFNNSFHSVDHLNNYSLTMDNLLLRNCCEIHGRPTNATHHIIPLYLNSNGFIKRQFKTTKTPLAKKRTTSLETLCHLKSTQIGPCMHHWETFSTTECNNARTLLHGWVFCIL